MNIINKIAELLQGPVLITHLDHWDLIGDKVEIVYSAQVGKYPEVIKYNDLLEVVPVEQISKPEVRNETDLDERELMMQADIEHYLSRKMLDYQSILNTINIESWKKQGIPVMYSPLKRQA